MTDKPILFSGPMVRALLDDSKNQTRRVLRPQPFPVGGPFYRPHPVTDPRQWHSVSARGTIANIQIVPYAPGDRLWVREHWRTHVAYQDLPPRDLGGEEPVRYEADGYLETWGWPFMDAPGRLRQGMHMPRWASRLTLIVTDVRVQRVQEMDRGDAMGEGCPFPNMAKGPNPLEWFADLWNDLNEKRGFGWDVNPWVCAVTFTVHHQNIDQMESA